MSMQKIPLEKLKVGMILAGDIIGPEGTVLAPAQSAVDEGLMRRLFMAGVEDVIVMGKHVQGYGIGYDAQRVCDRLPHLFRGYAADPFMMSLCKILMKHFKART